MATYMGDTCEVKTRPQVGTAGALNCGVTTDCMRISSVVECLTANDNIYYLKSRRELKWILMTSPPLP
jgi:hypothetical protein